MLRSLSLLLLLLSSFFGFSASVQAQNHVQAGLSGPEGTGSVTIDLSNNTFVADLPGTTQSHGQVITGTNGEICLVMTQYTPARLVGCFVLEGNTWIFIRQNGSVYQITGYRFF